MRRFPVLLFLLLCALAVGSGAPDLAHAENASQFATVAPGDSLQTQLQLVRAAGWSNLGLGATPGGSTPAAMTRYEMALETAKAVIAVRARHNADANWQRTASPAALRALRALCVAFKNELSSFEVNVPTTLNLLDELLAGDNKKDDSARAAADAGSTPGAPFALRLPPRREEFGAKAERENLMSSLSQKLRVYAALDSLAREAHDPFAAAPTAFSGGVQHLRAGATFEISPSLQLRANFQNENGLDAMRAPGLRDFLNDTAPDFLPAPFGASARSIGAGVDMKVWPGVTVSGDVAHLDDFSRYGDALRYDGGIGFSGWQNRVALSAHLSRLVPEDSLALGMTAARLNLGVELTSQIQLKLMYQQMFGAGAALPTNPRFGGGLDFNF